MASPPQSQPGPQKRAGAPLHSQPRCGQPGPPQTPLPRDPAALGQEEGVVGDRRWLLLSPVNRYRKDMTPSHIPSKWLPSADLAGAGEEGDRQESVPPGKPRKPWPELQPRGLLAPSTVGRGRQEHGVVGQSPLQKAHVKSLVLEFSLAWERRASACPEGPSPRRPTTFHAAAHRMPPAPTACMAGPALGVPSLPLSCGCLSLTTHRQAAAGGQQPRGVNRRLGGQAYGSSVYSTRGRWAAQSCPQCRRTHFSRAGAECKHGPMGAGGTRPILVSTGRRVPGPWAAWGTASFLPAQKSSHMG